MVASQSERTAAHPPRDKDVAIVGGGLAGLTCALRLSQRGYKVTLYEKAPMLGGNISSEKDDNGMHHDVYPHLFSDWYVNFWKIVQEDLKIRRDDAFELRMGVKVLQDPSGPHFGEWSRPESPAAPKAAATGPTPGNSPYQDLKNPTTLPNTWEDLWSGVLSPPDMFLVGFTLLDLASQPFHHSRMLDRQTVNGFLYSRGYATEDSADLHNMILMEIWSIQSGDTSADAYKHFVRHGLGLPYASPFAWLLRGSLEEMLVKPWRDKLTSGVYACTIKTSVAATGIELGDDHAVHLTLSGDTTARHANVVLAVPATELARLVGSGQTGKRIVDRVPELSELRRLRTARVLVLNLYFKVKLPDIPSEHVGLAGSLGYLTFLDISQLWTNFKGVKDHPTVLVLAASDDYAFPSGNAKEWAYQMIQELVRYLPAVEPGARWGATDGNIDYSRSWYQEKYCRRVFLNEVDADSYSPQPSYPDLPGVFFAGDFCVNDVKMASIEAAVVSGLKAANAVQVSAEGKSDITITPQMAPSHTELLAIKLALLPVAYGAKAWSTVNVALDNLAHGKIDRGLLSPVAGLSLLPLSYMADWWGTVEKLGIHVLSTKQRREITTSTIQPALSSAARVVVAAGDFFHSVISDASHKQTDELPSLRSLIKGVLNAVDKELREPLPSPRAAPAVAAGSTDPGWISAAAAAVETLRSALHEGSGPPPGSGRYRRHRAKP